MRHIERQHHGVLLWSVGSCREGETTDSSQRRKETCAAAAPKFTTATDWFLCSPPSRTPARA